MKFRTLLLTLSLSLFLTPVAFASDTVIADSVQLFMAKNPTWYLQLDLPDFSNPNMETSEDGKELYFDADKESQGFLVNIHIQPAQMGKSAVDCRNYYKRLRAKESTYKETNKLDWTYKNIAINEFEVKNFANSGLLLKNYDGCMVKDGNWISIAIAKLGYKRGDRGYVMDILKTVKLVDGISPKVEAEIVAKLEALKDKDALVQYNLGLYYFDHDNNKKALPYFKGALARNDKTNELDEDIWRHLINSLGISYGMAGDYENSLKTLEMGIAEYPEHGIFYYNLACAYAEMGDKENALKNLATAYQFKASLYVNEDGTILKPLKDSSFTSLVNDADFLKIASQFK